MMKVYSHQSSYSSLSSFRSLVILLLLFDCCWRVQLINGAIALVSKREQVGVEVSNLKTFCNIAERKPGGNENSTFLKIGCDKVPGPVMRLDLDENNYFRTTSGDFIAPSEFCVLNGKPSFGKLCPSGRGPLWKKCCAEDELLDATSLECRPSKLKYRPKIHSAHQSFTSLQKNAKDDQVSSKALECGAKFILPQMYSSLRCLPGSSGSFQLASNGTPMYQASTGVFLRKTHLKSADNVPYCVDGLLDFSLKELSSCGLIRDNGNYSSHNKGDDDTAKCLREMGEVLLICVDEKDRILFSNEDGDGIPKAYLFTALWLSTCPLLLSAAVANYCVIQKNVHGWILTSYLISMFLVNINSVILILDFAPSSLLVASTSKFPSLDGTCGIFDFTMKFLYMSSLCWMTAMNFGLWRTFNSSVRQVVEPRRFFLSALFSIGFPIIPVSVSYYVASLPDGDDDGSHSQIYHPLGSYNDTKSFQTCRRGTCPLYRYKTIPYYSGPILFLVLYNLAGFVKTSLNIASLRRQAEAVLHKPSKNHLETYFKLFLLTGSIWVIRVVLFYLQITDAYVTWYGFAFEAVFSIPEVAFPMIIFHHPDFIKWVWSKSPKLCRILVKCNPFCKRNSLFREGNSAELQSTNQPSGMIQHHIRHAVYAGTKYQGHSRFSSRTETTSSAGAAATSGKTVTITTSFFCPAGRAASELSA